MEMVTRSSRGSRNATGISATKPRQHRIENENELLKAALAVHTASQVANKRLEPFFAVLQSQVIREEGRKIAHDVKSRVKPPTDIVKKVLRKRRDAKKGTKNWAYEPKHVTDGCGFRIVVLFQEDIFLVIDQLLAMLRHESPYTDNPLIQENGLLEAIVYTNQPTSDGLDGFPQRVIRKLHHAEYQAETQTPENRKGGYSSVHFVVTVDLGDEVEGFASIPVEFQLRDIFEEAWCEIDHTLRYVNDRESNGQAAEMEVVWKRHLGALKTYADGCSQHAALIKETAIEFLKRRKAMGEAPSRPRPSERPVDLAEEIKGLLSVEFHEHIKEAFTAMERARDSLDDPGRVLLFEEAANAFDIVLKNADSEELEMMAEHRDVAYRLVMERAYCLQSMRRDEHVAEAMRIYRSVLKTWPDDAFATYRLAFLLRRTGKEGDAIKLYERGLELLNSDQSVRDDSWLRSAMPRQYGYALYY